MKSMTTIAGLLACTALATPPRAFDSGLAFDATQYEPDQGVGDPLPSGWYNVVIDEIGKKPTRDGMGEYVEMRFSVVDGQHQNRKVYNTFNTKNANQQTVEIANRQLSAVCHAVNVLKPTVWDQIKGIPLKIKVGPKPASGDYGPGNKILAYKHISHDVDTAGGDGGAAFGAGTPSPAPAATGGTPPAQPWAQAPAAAMASGADTAAPATPAAAPPPPPAAPAPEPAAPAAHDPMEAARADGWIAHPSAPGYHYKGQDVKLDAEVGAMYPAPAAPAAPASPPAPPAAPAADPAAAQGAPPPWAQPK